jgi:hypothetical protein
MVAALTGAATRHRPADLLEVLVVERETRRPVVNADVLNVGTGERRLTNAEGRARLPVRTGELLHFRVRQLGYEPADATLPMDAARVAAPLVVALSRFGVLERSTATASNACRGTADSLPSALSLLALEQLRFGAEQYARFWDTYPFRLSFERRTAYFTPEGRPLTVLVRHEESSRREWSDPYRVGHVVSGRGAASTAVPLSIQALSDPAFWEAHCLVARHVVTRDGRRMLPLEFLPALSLRDPDWGGVAWVDSTTSELQRIEFQLIGLGEEEELQRMEGFMTFVHPSPHNARPDSILSLWWARKTRVGDAWPAPTLVELVRIVGVRYLHDTPPAAPAAP